MDRSDVSDIPAALSAIAEGRCVVVVDDEDRENEGDLVMAADAASPEMLGFFVRYTSGLICVPLEIERADALALPPMTAVNQDLKKTAFTVSVDAREGVTTGISAADRARTARILADSSTMAADLVRPGHMFPLRARPNGVLERGGHTEAAVDLTRLAGRLPVGVIAEIVQGDGSMARLPELRLFAKEHGLPLVSVEALKNYRKTTERQVTLVATAQMPTIYGTFIAYGFRSVVDGAEHVALVMGDVADGRDVLVRVHSECRTGDSFGSLRCDCGDQLASAMEMIGTRRRGVVVYIDGHEGRGIGLLAKLMAYQLQDRGADTVDANVQLGLPVDVRDYSAAAHILAELGVQNITLLTNNPDKHRSLESFGLPVTRLPLVVPRNAFNEAYLETKKLRLGHLLEDGRHP